MYKESKKLFEDAKEYLPLLTVIGGIVWGLIILTSFYYATPYIKRIENIEATVKAIQEDNKEIKQNQKQIDINTNRITNLEGQFNRIDAKLDRLLINFGLQTTHNNP